MTLPPHILSQVLMELAVAFPEHHVTLVLRHADDASLNAVLTTDVDSTLAAAMLGAFALSHVPLGEVRH